MVEESPSNNGCSFLQGFHLALPDHDDAPAEMNQTRMIRRIPPDIDIKLSYPEIRVGFRNCGALAAWVPMPEATVHEYDRFPFAEY